MSSSLACSNLSASLPNKDYKEMKYENKKKIRKMVSFKLSKEIHKLFFVLSRAWGQRKRKNFLMVTQNSFSLSHAGENTERNLSLRRNK